MDAVFLIEIILTFFIGIPIDEISKQANQVLDSKRSYNHNMKDIAVRYLNSTLIFDLCSLIPTAVFWVEYTDLYYLKILRVLHQFKNAHDFSEMMRWLMDKYSTTTIHKSERIRNYI